MGLISRSFGDGFRPISASLFHGHRPVSVGQGVGSGTVRARHQFRVTDLTVVPFILTNAMCDATVSFL